MSEELVPCRLCGALPCDQTDTRAALRERPAVDVVAENKRLREALRIICEDDCTMNDALHVARSALSPTPQEAGDVGQCSNCEGSGIGLSGDCYKCEGSGREPTP